MFYWVKITKIILQIYCIINSIVVNKCLDQSNDDTLVEKLIDTCVILCYKLLKLRKERQKVPLFCDKCDQIGLFLNGLGDQFTELSSKKFWKNSLTFLKTINFSVQSAAATFSTTFGKIGLLFIPRSGHTDCVE